MSTTPADQASGQQDFLLSMGCWGCSVGDSCGLWGVSHVGVRIVRWESRNAQCLSCDEAERTFESDLITKLSREGG